MDRTATQDLTSLLPSLSALPPELVELASSLFAQSRSQATSLKPDEEVARSYACAHIACERLKTRLDLPNITARPPCPPRIYKKLFAFLDSTLQARTPRKRARDVDDDVNAQHSTPTRAGQATANAKQKRHDASSARYPIKRRTPKRQKQAASVVDCSELLPMIRGVCEVLGAKEAMPHVYSGVRVEATAIDPEQYPALIIAITLATLKKLGRRLPARPSEAAAAKMIEFDDTLVQRGFYTINEAKNVEDLVMTASELSEDYGKDWQKAEWCTNIETLTIERDGDATDDVYSEINVRPGADEDDLNAVMSSKISTKSLETRKAGRKEGDDLLAPGLGTMFCAAVDWLSDERRAAYAHWEQKILAQIEILS